MVTSRCVHHHGSELRQKISWVVITQLQVGRYVYEKSHEDESEDRRIENKNDVQNLRWVTTQPNAEMSLPTHDRSVLDNRAENITLD